MVIICVVGTSISVVIYHVFKFLQCVMKSDSLNITTKTKCVFVYIVNAS